MIIFKELRWKNFLSTGNNFNVIDLNDKKTNLIIGTNGMGKSTILDAIAFVLFNKPFRKINLPQLVNNINGKDCLVEITFSINDVEYKVVRGMKPKVFEIWVNGNMLQQDAANNDYQEHLEQRILKMNFKAFTQVVVIGNATYQPFMKLSPNDRRNIVESFLDIDIFTKMNSLLKSKVLQAKESLNNVSYKYDLSKVKLKMAKVILSNSHEMIQKKIQENEEQIKKKEIVNSVKMDSAREIQEEISQIVHNDEAMGRLQDRIKKLSEFLVSFKTKKKTAEKEIAFLHSADSCNTCKQKIDPNFKKANLEEKQVSVAKFDKAITEAEAEIHKSNTQLAEAMKTLEAIREKNAEIERINIDIAYNQKDISRLQQENKNLLEEKKANTQKNEGEYEALVGEVHALSEERDVLISEQHLNSIAAILLKDDGIKTKIIKHYLPVINKLINKYLHLMDFYINYGLDENFDEVIKTPSRDGFSYSSFSEGEKLRIDLSILFAWREIAKSKNSANTNLLILDEIFDSSLDNSGIDDFLNILNNLSENANVFVISHKADTLFDKFHNVIRFQKVRGFSKIA